MSDTDIPGGLTGGQEGGVVKHIQHRIDPDTITALCGHTEGVGRYGADRAWEAGELDDQPQTYTEAVDRGYDAPPVSTSVKRHPELTPRRHRKLTPRRNGVCC